MTRVSYTKERDARYGITAARKRKALEAKKKEHDEKKEEDNKDKE